MDNYNRNLNYRALNSPSSLDILFKKKYIKYKTKYMILCKIINQKGGDNSQTENLKKIDDVLDYAKTMIGVPYRWFRQGEDINGTDKFWADNTGIVLRKHIDTFDKCIVCTGLINLIRRYLKLSIPGLDGEGPKYAKKFPGTTGIWFGYLKRKGRLQKLDITKKYPKGTLLLKNFESIDNDQGHVAVIIDEFGNTVLEQNILHSFANYLYNESYDMKNVGETNIQNFKDIHFGWKELGYFTHVCYPENWLLKE
jgi:hypothetical protein